MVIPADRIAVNFERVLAIFQVVAITLDLRGKLLRLAHRDETCAEMVGQGWCEDEATGLHSDNGINLSAAEVVGDPVNHGAQSTRVLEQRGDVVEENARIGEIGDL